PSRCRCWCIRRAYCSARGSSASSGPCLSIRRSPNSARPSSKNRSTAPWTFSRTAAWFTVPGPNSVAWQLPVGDISGGPGGLLAASADALAVSWPFHAIHHSPKELDWLSTERFHPVNTYISYLLSLTVLILFFEDPFIFALCMPLRKAYGMFIHANVNISYGPFDFVLASPLFHHWHHAASEMADKNYCTFFSFLDWMFGTYYLPKDKKEPASVGLAQDDLANRFWPQMVYPFIKLARMKTR
ncbi:MAG: fatty acid hydroxylase family protein, partial [Nitrospina sp.]